MALPTPGASLVAFNAPSGAVRRSVAGENGSLLRSGTGLGKKSPATPVDIGARQTRGFRVQPEIVGKPGQSSGDGAGIVSQRKSRLQPVAEIGRASCRERVCQYV